MMQYNAYGWHRTTLKRQSTSLTRSAYNLLLGTNGQPRYTQAELRTRGIAQLREELTALVYELRQWDNHRFERRWTTSTNRTAAQRKRMRIIHQVIKRDMTVDEAYWRRSDDPELCSLWDNANFELDMQFALAGINVGTLQL